MDKTKVYSFYGAPAIILSEEQDYVLALVLLDGMETPTTLIAHKDELERYNCPYVDECRIYCKDALCEYEVFEEEGFTCLSCRCNKCMIDSKR